MPRTFKARPTTDFAKENIFNVLNGYIDFEGTTALDLFSGTGSISLELVSRGCQQVISVEADRDHHAFIKQCVAKLGAGNCVTIRGDVFRFIKGCKQQFDFIFCRNCQHCQSSCSRQECSSREACSCLNMERRTTSASIRISWSIENTEV